MSRSPRKFPHIYLSANGQREDYTRPPRSGGNSTTPERDRAVHAQNLELAIGKALQEARQVLDSRQPDIAVGEPGFYLEFQVQTDGANTLKSPALKSLENQPKKIELVSVNSIPDEEGLIAATVFVPETASDFFLQKVEQYRDKETKNGKPKNEQLVSRIEDVQIGTVRSLFTDEPALFPEEQQEIWWEVWLRKDRLETFELVVARLDIQFKPHPIRFPEREVILAMTNVRNMAKLIKNSDAVAELRIAKDVPSIFLEMGPKEQSDWANDLVERLIEPGQHSVAICVLDSGVTRTHSLIDLALLPEDMHTVDPNWGENDIGWKGHGTAMAGVALYEDLSKLLQTTKKEVKLLHRIESVKILPRTGANDPELYGAITGQGISLPEIQAPDRRRVFCMAVTSDYGSKQNGTPSSWSAAIDQLCFNENELRRLIIISAGNINDDISPEDYLNINDLEAIQNPGQAWNPLVVGAYTEKINIIDPGYTGWQTLAPCGDLSPRSRTSVDWESQWPIRPDIVFEGGNMAYNDQNPAIPIDDLSILTTHYRPNIRTFDYMGDTSCATALASYMAARIMTEQPTYWPETVRALIVHSAEWTPAMQAHFDQVGSSKAMRRALVRRYGYGVPDLNRALQSANNDLTLITEDKLQPFFLDKDVKTKDLMLHKLPWPSNVLAQLGEVLVELKVTLSYFIEPNPGERGWAYKHRYSSHGLRFEVKASLESDDDFKWRINKAARNEEEGKRELKADNENWFLGPKTRDSGSIHSDIWQGTAVELAQKDAIAVYPVGGWWKEKKYLDRYDQISYYSLIVSIRVPDVEVDIYTPVSTLVGTPVALEI